METRRVSWVVLETSESSHVPLKAEHSVTEGVYVARELGRGRDTWPAAARHGQTKNHYMKCDLLGNMTTQQLTDDREKEASIL